MKAVLRACCCTLMHELTKNLYQIFLCFLLVECWSDVPCWLASKLWFLVEKSSRTAAYMCPRSEWKTRMQQAFTLGGRNLRHFFLFPSISVLVLHSWWLSLILCFKSCYEVMFSRGWIGRILVSYWICLHDETTRLETKNAAGFTCGCWNCFFDCLNYLICLLFEMLWEIVSRVDSKLYMNLVLLEVYMYG